ncbi:ribosome hibernation-promoting factor, HPF/YfiA family [Candidatus Margulisiibacteriota bacterium]
MQINLQGHGIDLTEPLKEYTNKKIGKLDEFFSRITKAEVVLDARKIQDNNRSQVAEVSIWASEKKLIRASEAAQDMYAAIDLVYEELKRQLKKHKEKHVQERRRSGEKLKRMAREYHPEAKSEQDGPIIVKRKNFNIPVMDIKAAEQELKLTKQEFIVFVNAESGDINVFHQEKNIESAGLLPLTQEAAAKILSEGKRNIITYLNDKTNQLNVLYKRNSGNFGLIEP